MNQRVLIISNRLPISIREEGNELTVQHSNGGLATALSSVMDQYNARWIGWAGLKKKVLPGTLHNLHIDKRLSPVSIPEDRFAGFYDRMANGILWPMLHGIEPVLDYEASDWKDYTAVNKRFARAIKRTARPNDVIWLHDYHLLLVPQLLRAAGLQNRIGFFLHTPFRPGKMLACIPGYRQILESMAQLDVLGFQTQADVRAFRETMKQEKLSMRPQAVVRDFPIGVDFVAFNRSQSQPAVQQHATAIAPQCKKKKVILSVSRLDYTKGIVEQLLAFEQLLDSYPKPGSLLYRLIVAPSREDAPGYRELKYDIDLQVHRINNKSAHLGQPPILYTYRNCDFNELNAWYARADIMLVAPLIDGMNLVAKEFVAAGQTARSLVISDTIGAAQQLRTAIQVSPTNIPAVTNALREALIMSPEERATRWRDMRNNVQLEDVFWWVAQYMHALMPIQESTRQQATNMLKYMYDNARNAAS